MRRGRNVWKKGYAPPAPPSRTRAGPRQDPQRGAAGQEGEMHLVPAGSWRLWSAPIARHADTRTRERARPISPAMPPVRPGSRRVGGLSCRPAMLPRCVGEPHSGRLIGQVSRGWRSAEQRGARAGQQRPPSPLRTAQPFRAGGARSGIWGRVKTPWLAKVVFVPTGSRTQPAARP